MSTVMILHKKYFCFAGGMFYNYISTVKPDIETLIHHLEGHKEIACLILLNLVEVSPRGFVEELKAKLLPLDTHNDSYVALADFLLYNRWETPMPTEIQHLIRVYYGMYNAGSIIVK